MIALFSDISISHFSRTYLLRGILLIRFPVGETPHRHNKRYVRDERSRGGILCRKVAGTPSAAGCLALTYPDEWIHGLPRRASRRQRAAREDGWVGMMGRGIGNSGARERYSNAGYTTLLFTLEPEEILHFQTTLSLRPPPPPLFYLFSPIHPSYPRFPPLPRNGPTCAPPPPSFTSHLSSSSAAEGRAEVCVRAALHYHL